MPLPARRSLAPETPVSGPARSSDCDRFAALLASAELLCRTGELAAAQPLVFELEGLLAAAEDDFLLLDRFFAVQETVAELRS